MKGNTRAQAAASISKEMTAIFTDHCDRSKPLALHPEAIGVAYRSRKTEDVATVVGGVAVLSIDGPLMHKGDGWWCFWETYEDLYSRFKMAIDDDAVASVVLKFDSPGGEVAGLNETVRMMLEAKKASGKKVIAYVDEACYSAAYALAMVADEIYCPEAGGVGSIGVITLMADMTEADRKAGLRVEVIASGSKKTDGHPHVPLSDGAIKRTKRRVDQLAQLFFGLVSEGRGLSTEAVSGFQAGTFMGQAAVDAGLVDGVMSLQDVLTIAANLFSSTQQPTDRSVGKEPGTMSKLIAATKELNDANAALAAAKTDSDRALAAARVLAAEAKYKHEKKTTTETEESDEDADDDADDDASDAGSDAADDDDSDADDSDSGSDSTGAEAGDDARTGLYTKDRLLRLARQITGERSIESVMGALHAMGQAHKKTAKLAAKVAKLEGNAIKSELAALISGGMKAGKLAPSQRAWAREQSPASLRAYLAATPKAVHTADDEHTEARVEGTGDGAVTAEMARIWKKQGFAEADYPRLLAKMNGKSTAKGAN